VRVNLEEQSAAVESMKTRQRPHRTEKDRWKSSTFFDVKAEGGEDRLAYNESHSFTKELTIILQDLVTKRVPTNDLMGRVRRLLEVIFIAYYRSKMLLEDAGEMQPQDIFDTLELNWGAILESYVESESSRE
jgi:hypothetical protein